MTTYRKQISNVGLVVGGIIITEGGGDGEFVTITSPEYGGSTVGVHRDIVLWDASGGAYEVQISLLETATANESLQSLMNAQVNGTFRGTYDFMMEDIGTGETLTGQCIFIKEPDREKAAEPATYQWTLHVSADTPTEYSSRTVTVP